MNEINIESGKLGKKGWIKYIIVSVILTIVSAVGAVIYFFRAEEFKELLKTIKRFFVNLKFRKSNESEET